MNTQPQTTDLVFLFPGQGAYHPGALRTVRHAHPEIDDVLAAVDAVARAQLGVAVSSVLLDPNAPSLARLLVTEPDVAQLAIYATSVAVASVLERQNVEPAALLGHSLGEIAALVAAGAFAVGDGAAIVCHRQQALRSTRVAGRMAALGAPVHTAEMLVSLVGSQRVTVAVENGDQTVVSGTEAGIEAMAQAARAAGISFVTLDSPSPFHNPALAPAVAELAVRLRSIAQRPLRRPVHSPILGRAYTDEDNLTDCLAAHLVQRVRFASLVERLATASPTWVEVGAGATLGKLVRRAVPSATTVACLDGVEGSFDTALSTLTHRPATTGSVDRRLTPVPDMPPTNGGNGAPTATATPATDVMDLTVTASTPTAVPATATPDVLDLTATRAAAPAGAPTTDIAGMTASAAAPALAPVGVTAPASPLGETPMSTAAPATAGVFTPAPDPAATSAAAAPVGVTSAAAAGMESAGGAVTDAASGGELDRDEVGTRLVRLYAEALEYPEEVFTDDVVLERDLGIDSVKQTELLAQSAELYGLPVGSDFRLSDYDTMGKVIDYVMTHAAEQGVGAGAGRTS